MITIMTYESELYFEAFHDWTSSLPTLKEMNHGQPRGSNSTGLMRNIWLHSAMLPKTSNGTAAPRLFINNARHLYALDEMSKTLH